MKEVLLAIEPQGADHDAHLHLPVPILPGAVRRPAQLHRRDAGGLSEVRQLDSARAVPNLNTWKAKIIPPR